MNVFVTFLNIFYFFSNFLTSVHCRPSVCRPSDQKCLKLLLAAPTDLCSWYGDVAICHIWVWLICVGRWTWLLCCVYRAHIVVRLALCLRVAFPPSSQLKSARSVCQVPQSVPSSALAAPTSNRSYAIPALLSLSVAFPAALLSNAVYVQSPCRMQYYWLWLQQQPI